MPTIDVTGAPDRLLANKTVTPGHCLGYVSRAIRNGEPPLDWDGLDTALDCWNLGCGDKHDSRDVPRGFPAFLGAKRGSNAGDVMISLGGGKFAATDYPTWGVVGICTLEQREAQTGRKYLGYAGQFLGYTLTSTATAASLKPTPVNLPIGARTMIKIVSPTRGQAVLGAGYFRHLNTDEEVHAADLIVDRALMGTDRQYDLWRSIALFGDGANSADDEEIKAVVTPAK